MKNCKIAFALIPMLFLAGVLLCSCNREEEVNAVEETGGKPLKEIRYVEMPGNEEGISRIVIDFEKPLIVSQFNENGEVSGSRTYVYDAEETVKVVDRLRTCDFSKCKMAYGDVSSPYEVSWILDIEYMDGEKMQICGVDKWPECFDRGFGIKATRQDGEKEIGLWMEMD